MTRASGSGRGSLYVVAVPIGDPDDLTIRARRILRDVAWVLAEDPAATQRLLAHHRIATPLTSYHNLNKEEKTAVVLARLREGHSLALVCDAGTPLVCDPGAYLVGHARRAGLAVVPVPGPSAVMAALSVAGVSADAFVFAGTMPPGGPRRRAFLGALRTEPRTQVVFASARDLPAILKAVASGGPARLLTVASDLTRAGERVVSGTVREVEARRRREALKGELTLVIGPKERAAPPPASPPHRQEPRKGTSDAGQGSRRLRMTTR